MFRSRRFWICISLSLPAVILPALAYRFLWYPHTLRGRFDQIEMSMPAERVLEIMGETGDFRLVEFRRASTGTPIRIDGGLTYVDIGFVVGEVWQSQNGITIYRRFDEWDTFRRTEWGVAVFCGGIQRQK